LFSYYIEKTVFREPFSIFLGMKNDKPLFEKGFLKNLRKNEKEENGDV
jgi:hypothetical protein